LVESTKPFPFGSGFRCPKERLKAAQAELGRHQLNLMDISLRSWYWGLRETQRADAQCKKCREIMHVDMELRHYDPTGDDGIGRDFLVFPRERLVGSQIISTAKSEYFFPDFFKDNTRLEFAEDLDLSSISLDRHMTTSSLYNAPNQPEAKRFTAYNMSSVSYANSVHFAGRLFP